MLWATKRCAPASRAAARRWRVPSLRSLLVRAKSRSNVRGLMRAGIAVSWWITASGRASTTAARTAASSSASATAARAPVPSSSRACSGERVIPVT